MINEQKKLNNLLKWCEHMREKHEIRFQPNNPPVDVILDEILGDIRDFKQSMALISDCLTEARARLEAAEKTIALSIKEDKKAEKKR